MARTDDAVIAGVVSAGTVIGRDRDDDGGRASAFCDGSYLDVFVDGGIYTDEVQTSYISEGLADIYQELKDLAAAFQTGEEPIMNDAVVICRQAFLDSWGRKLLAVLRALHEISDASYQ